MLETQEIGLLTFTVIKRNGMLVPFRKDRIAMAIEAAFRDTKKLGKQSPLPEELCQTIQWIVDLVVEEAMKSLSSGAGLTVEGVQDIVEIKMMEAGYHDVARDYIIYRDKHKALRDDSPRNLKVMRRDGRTWVRFNPIKIASALERAFRDSKRLSGNTPQEIVDVVNRLTDKLVQHALTLARRGVSLSIEQIQDDIERLLMTEGFYDVAKDFILFRAMRAQLRQSSEEPVEEPPLEATGVTFTVIGAGGNKITLSASHLRKRIAYAARGMEAQVEIDALVEQSLSHLFDGIKESEVDLSNILAARSKIEVDPAYSKVASNLLLDMLYRETMQVEASSPHLKESHQRYFKEMLQRGVSLHRIDPVLLSFDLDLLGGALDLQRDLQFSYLGLQTLYDRYFIHDNHRRLETPQIFWMRVAMGLALGEGAQKNQRAIEFYHVLSRFLFLSSTPTLFNSGTLHPQLSSCYLSTVIDDLGHIFKVVSDDAQLSKWAGGIGNDWTNVRATGANIKGTNGKSQGVIPFLKVANDTAVAVNQGGKRKGAMCAYLEIWHLDIEDFFELRKNTGDDRRRTHDMHTAAWIPDLFMKRVQQNGLWTLFSPNDVPDLHHLYGEAFERRYTAYEEAARRGEIALFKQVEALQLWRKLLGMLFETGHPWVTFKDPSNIRSPQDHVGIVHCSNLCTEILLNTSEEETAVCNLGSVNLPAHLTSTGEIDRALLQATVRTAIRMLDNVIDINFYPTPEARNSNLRHRPVGMGMMGFQDALYLRATSYASYEAVEFADESMELLSYFALLASSELAQERGCYPSYRGSKWDRGLLPLDTLALLARERGGDLEVDTSARLDWTPVREQIKKWGMRNSNTMAIAPTATISNVTGITQSIEPMYKHLFVKSNLSGEFTVLNVHLVERLKALGLWDAEMVDDLKYFDGALSEIERIPAEIKRLFPTAFDIEPDWLIECASRRQKWIDMGQSLNLYLAEPSGKKLHAMYFLSWKKGLKTNYYLRSTGATHIEKSTTDINKRGLQPRWMKSESPSHRVQVQREAKGSCSLSDPTCESCQ